MLKFKKVTQTKINVKILHDFDVENIPVKLQYGEHNTWRIIVFTMLSELGLDWKFKKVTQRSTWLKFWPSCNMMQANSEELSHSQSVTTHYLTMMT